MKNKEIAKIFNRMADILEFKGDVSFRVNSYRRAARILDDLTEDIQKIEKSDYVINNSGTAEQTKKAVDAFFNMFCKKK